MMDYQDLNLTEKKDYWIAQGWAYIADSATWTGGIWYHEDMGSVNQGGGSFATIMDALAAIERFTSNLQMC